MSSKDLIDPARFPSLSVSVSAVRGAAKSLAGLSSRVDGYGGDIQASWSGLPLSFVVTGSEGVYAAMAPAVDATSSVSQGLSAVSKALYRWLSDVEPILDGFDRLTVTAAKFRHEALHFQGQWDLQGQNLWVDSWDQDHKMVDKNNTLLGKSWVLADRLRVANETLANAIRAAASLETAKVAPAVKKAPDGVKTGWGNANGVQESCAGKVVGFPKDFTLGFAGGALNMLSGLGQLLTGYDFKSWPPPPLAEAQLVLSGDYRGARATMNAYFGGWGQAWVGMGHLGTSIVLGGFGAPVMSELLVPAQINAIKDAGGDTSVLEGVQQWLRDSNTAGMDAVGGFIGYHAPTDWWKATPEEWGAGFSDWADDPGQAFGGAAFNIASVVVPVPGVAEVAAALKGGAAGAENALRVAADATSTATTAGAHAADLSVAGGRADLDSARLGTGEIDPTARLQSLTDDLAHAGTAADHLAEDIHGLDAANTDLAHHLGNIDRIHTDTPHAPTHNTPPAAHPAPSSHAAPTHAAHPVDGSRSGPSGPTSDTNVAGVSPGGPGKPLPGSDEPALVPAGGSSVGGSSADASASAGGSHTLDLEHSTTNPGHTTQPTHTTTADPHNQPAASAGEGIPDQPPAGRATGDGAPSDPGTPAHDAGPTHDTEPSHDAGSGDDNAAATDPGASDPSTGPHHLDENAPADLDHDGHVPQHLNDDPATGGHVVDSAGRDITDTVTKSGLSMDELSGYLEGVNPTVAHEFVATGIWPEDVQIPKDASVLGDDGRIDWAQAPEGGYVLDGSGHAIKQPYVPPIGERIDRYSPPNGSYTSPVPDSGPYPYDKRSLPYIEDPGHYHQYEVIGDLSELKKYYERAGSELQQILDDLLRRNLFDWGNLVQKGSVAEAFKGTGTAIQYELPLSVDILESLGVLKEIAT